VQSHLQHTSTETKPHRHGHLVSLAGSQLTTAPPPPSASYHRDRDLVLPRSLRQQRTTRWWLFYSQFSSDRNTPIARHFHSNSRLKCHRQREQRERERERESHCRTDATANTDIESLWLDTQQATQTPLCEYSACIQVR
jgi:hypothetical protein